MPHLGDHNSKQQPWDVVKPKVTLEDVAGMEDVTHRLQRAFLELLANDDLREAFGIAAHTRLLLYGPPACGKTFVAHALAGELGVPLVSAGLHEECNRWLGESEDNLHELFACVRRMAPAVLFIDQLDALGRSRSSLGPGAAMRNVVSQFLAELDGVDFDNEGVLFIAATNRPWHIDPVLQHPGRFDRMLLVPPPDDHARLRILRDTLDGRPTDDGLDVSAVVGRTEGCSGTDLVQVVESAAHQALAASIESGTVESITEDHLLAATTEVRATTGQWFQTARSHATFSRSGRFDDLLSHVRSHGL